MMAKRQGKGMGRATLVAVGGGGGGGCWRFGARKNVPPCLVLRCPPLYFFFWDGLSGLGRTGTACWWGVGSAWVVPAHCDEYVRKKAGRDAGESCESYDRAVKRRCSDWCRNGRPGHISVSSTEYGRDRENVNCEVKCSQRVRQANTSPEERGDKRPKSWLQGWGYKGPWGPRSSFLFPACTSTTCSLYKYLYVVVCISSSSRFERPCVGGAKASA